jgi:hypothetical protein
MYVHREREKREKYCFNGLSEGTTRRWEKKENDRVNNTEVCCICVKRKYNLVYCKLLNNREWGAREKVTGCSCEESTI